MLEAAAEGKTALEPTAPVERFESGGGVAVFMGTESPLTRAIGLGSRGPVSEEEVESVERFFLSRGAPVRIAVGERAHPTLISVLEQRGYTRSLPMQNWYLRMQDRPPGVKFEVSVEQAERSKAQLWARTVGIGFQESGRPENDLDPTKELLFQTLGFAADSRAYFAVHKGEVAGGAVLSVCGDAAFLRTASSRWAHRAHGVQMSLITARLDEAEKLGCTVVFSSTQGSTTSERNLIRSGFRRLSQSCVMEKAAR